MRSPTFQELLESVLGTLLTSHSCEFVKSTIGAKPRETARRSYIITDVFELNGFGSALLK